MAPPVLLEQQHAGLATGALARAAAVRVPAFPQGFSGAQQGSIAVPRAMSWAGATGISRHLGRGDSLARSPHLGGNDERLIETLRPLGSPLHQKPEVVSFVAAVRDLLRREQ